MMQTLKFVAVLVGVSVSLVCVGKTMLMATEVSDSAEPQPVEESMHEFMEYVFQPTYRRLKANMAQEPANKAAWKPVKSDALILAESTNLLLHRLPDENANHWKAASAKVRQAGAELYRAAKEQDNDKAQTAYRSMLNRCNACHRQFADGKYQLKP